MKRATERLPAPATPSKWAFSALEASEIREQLDRLLVSPQIRSSKRCQALLQYIVVSALEGEVDGLKERVLGCEVFRREPHYDTNQDSIVRTTAAEIRKRLALYYLEPGREGEIRILLPSGSYLPEFQFPKPAVVTAPILVAPPLAQSTWSR